MEQQYTPIKGLHLNARFYQDIQREWELCRTHQATLEHLSITVESMRYTPDEKMTFPKLKELQVFTTGRFTIDKRGMEKTYADSYQMREPFVVLQRWMATHSFPVLERIQVLWSNYVSVDTLSLGELDHYDVDGPIYDTDYESEDVEMSMDAVWYHYAIGAEYPDLSWMNDLNIKKLHLSSAMYEYVDPAGYSFEITTTRDFTQEEENEMLEKLAEF